MVDISLNCRLFRDVEENHKFTMVANNTYSIENFKKKIKEKIREAGNDILNDIEADHLSLCDKDEFSNLTLDTKNKNVKKLEGLIGDYWAMQPLKNFTHVIIDSPYLTIAGQEKEKAENLSERKILPVLDHARSELLDKIIDEFWEKFINVPFTSVCESLVDDKEAIIAFMDPGTPDHLPAKFKGFPVFVCYEALELHHRSFHKELIPGTCMVFKKKGFMS
ncbi:7895_t:CDS:2 [Funneliformis geosporum]|uniref:8636_t:CDS:1 n=1 Tax=Funneliformis geosporum TaxID=1117311 RepID=A0A9W4SS57_9GLOM|nr:7895_t:CDS:2 [Funneliformis geosporum]CAI2180972.1 8636_t:CDS:2 [Funneliformis geosporum]